MDRKKLARVDIQVCIFVAFIVLISFTCVYISNFYFTYKDMIASLSNRAESIYQYVESSFDKNTFQELNVREDEQKDSYQKMKPFLENIKHATGVRYLYTAKKNEDGKLIYLVDGLPYDSPDFRYVGDLIEPEIYPDLEAALANQIIMPSEILSTSWGNVFICYFPIHDGNEVVGALGIEFDAERQYMTFKSLGIMTALIGLAACALAVLFAFKFFRRISNPVYKDIYNTDHLTKIKNRNSFEIDMHNFMNRGCYTNFAVIVADLNGLKKTNDSFGHAAGDQLLQTAADILNKACGEKAFLYRVGGDEFVIITNAEHSRPETIIAQANALVEDMNASRDIPLSIAMGYACFDARSDHTIFETYRRADKEMYKTKQSMKSALQ